MVHSNDQEIGVRIQKKGDSVSSFILYSDSCLLTSLNTNSKFRIKSRVARAYSFEYINVNPFYFSSVIFEK